MDNLQTDPRELFHAIRCGFARAYELLSPPGSESSNATAESWRVATEVFPDAVLDEVIARAKAKVGGP